MTQVKWFNTEMSVHRPLHFVFSKKARNKLRITFHFKIPKWIQNRKSI